MQERIDIQRKQLKAGNPVLKLVEPCTLGNGIAQLSAEKKKVYQRLFEKLPSSIKVVQFIPASGSGSRMFDALFDFSQNTNPGNSTLSFVSEFMKRLGGFAFYDKLSAKLQQDLNDGTANEREVIDFVLSEKGLNFSKLPKGLIPFHKYDDQRLDAFQAHVLHGLQLHQQSGFHFTINRSYETEVRKSLEAQQKSGAFTFTFSEQDKETDAFAFDKNFNPVADEKGNTVRRPAGHGTLLKNLESIDADIIFIRNIDNIQHQSQCAVSLKTRQMLGGVLLELLARRLEILRDLDAGKNNVANIQALNNAFDLRIPADKMNDRDFLFDLLNRPVRVCGMVRNEGQPGGGPFWVKDEQGLIRRQIIEKSQIAENAEQLKMLDAATHFNPVEIVCSTKNFRGEKFNLTDFRNDNQYFVVHKTEKGKPIQYIEQPGLWNGGMDKWITVFYEIDSACFSPVKTVLDLLKPAHQGQ